MEASPTKPLLFISHKHIDAPLAAVIKDFILSRTANKVRVYLSSDASSEGPAIGMNLDDELQGALQEASVVLFLYTLSDYDWSFCMYECGVATDPASPHTKVFVIQCGDDIPQPFSDKVRVRASEPEDIAKLTRALLTDENFFAGHGPITDFESESKAVSDAATELHEKLKDILPKQGSSNGWPVWPKLEIELDRSRIAEILEAPSDKRLALAAEELGEAKVFNATPGAAMLFEMNSLADGTPFAELTAGWQTEYPDQSPTWLNTMAAQVLAGAANKKAKAMRWEPLREVGGKDRYLMGATRVQVVPGEGGIRIEFYFYRSGTARPVRSVMTRIEKIQKVNFDKKPPEQVKLSKLLRIFEDDGWHRIPIVTAEGLPKYIVHTSMIDRFISRKASAGEDVTGLTLADLLADEQLGKMFASTFATVSEEATLADASEVMTHTGNCQDVFVTEKGTDEEPVLGWLTDREIAEALET